MEWLGNPTQPAWNLPFDPLLRLEYQHDAQASESFPWPELTRLRVVLVLVQLQNLRVGLPFQAGQQSIKKKTCSTLLSRSLNFGFRQDLLSYVCDAKVEDRRKQRSLPMLALEQLRPAGNQPCSCCPSQLCLL